MPRAPINLTPDQVREVETLAALLSQDQIADYFGFGRTTFHEIMKRDPAVAEHFIRETAKAIAQVANGLLQKARNGCTTSSIFHLITQAGWRETERIGHTGEDLPRTKEALAAAKARGVKLGNPNGAAALRRAGNGGVALREAVSRNADAFAEGLAPVIEGMQAEGVTTLRGLADALNERGMMTRRGGRWHVSNVRGLLLRLAR